MNWGEALLWGTLIVAVLFAVLATSYFLSDISFLI